MRVRAYLFRVAILVSTCAGSAIAQSPSPGLIATDEGGAPGYQHSLERSRFITRGATDGDLRRVEEHGFAKVVGPDGVFATNRQNGLTIAVQSDSSDKGDVKAGGKEAKAGYVINPDKHNEQVVNYFVAAGVPKDQIGGVHPTTYLSSSGSLNDPRPAPPKVDGYASVLERKIDNRDTVVDSVAWARMNEQGEVVSEWVYWPAIPAKALADARRLEELTGSSSKADFLARLPVGLPPGRVVIRHSSATEEGPFVVFASYDIVERRPTPKTAGGENLSSAPTGVSVVRHFDVDGVERRLPQERRNLGPVDPKEKQPPQTAPVRR